MLIVGGTVDGLSFLGYVHITRCNAGEYHPEVLSLSLLSN